MISAGSLKDNGASTERQMDQPNGSAEISTQNRRESSVFYRESSNSHTTYVTDDENETLERAEIKTAELATIRQMADPEERIRARSRSGSTATATATEGVRKRNSPDYSPPPMPRLPMDVKGPPGDSSDLSSRGTSIVEGQLAAIPVSLANRMSPPVPWTPSPAATPLQLDTSIHYASPQYSTFDSSRRPPWQPLRLNSP